MLGRPSPYISVWHHPHFTEGKIEVQMLERISSGSALPQFCFCTSEGSAPCSALWSAGGFERGGAWRVILSRVSQGKLLSAKLNNGGLFPERCYLISYHVSTFTFATQFSPNFSARDDLFVLNVL